MSRKPCLRVRVGYDGVMARRLAEHPAEVPHWTFLTNHSHVLICLAQNPEIRLTEIARKVGIGERAVHGIVHDLVQAGYVNLSKSGRHNVYEVRLDRPLRHPNEASCKIIDVFGPLTAAT